MAQAQLAWPFVLAELLEVEAPLHRQLLVHELSQVLLLTQLLAVFPAFLLAVCSTCWSWTARNQLRYHAKAVNAVSYFVPLGLRSIGLGTW